MLEVQEGFIGNALPNRGKERRIVVEIVPTQKTESR